MRMGNSDDAAIAKEQKHFDYPEKLSHKAQSYSEFSERCKIAKPLRLLGELYVSEESIPESH
jgi:hypothetical protein